jgi:CO/xanthine dehydrogenase Mo-binding subunit
MRSLGAFGNVYAIETLMDLLAARAGQNPFEYRLQHLTDERARAVLEHTKQLSESSGFFSETPNSSWGLGFAKYKNIAAYCAVIVRIDFSEEMKISEIISVLDAGEVINPDAVINQTEGGIIQAMSWGTLEAVKFEGCQVAVDSWLDYPIAKFSEIPRISVKLIPRPELPPMGCAEAAQGPTVAAIGNAIFRSIGTHVKDLPLTRDAIFSAAINS